MLLERHIDTFVYNDIARSLFHVFIVLHCMQERYDFKSPKVIWPAQCNVLGGV